MFSPDGHQGLKAKGTIKLIRIICPLGKQFVNKGLVMRGSYPSVQRELKGFIRVHPCESVATIRFLY
jgi:hypothetical protein